MWTSSLFEYEFILPGKWVTSSEIGVRETLPFSAKTVWISLPECQEFRAESLSDLPDDFFGRNFEHL
ncbi:hypothetical protein TNCV_3829441 [Trichonephila clavipes]|nr:hypothetical protein TNCV_3829441 [Trichonephila clavipes]